MKKIIPILLVLILVFSGCAAKEEPNNSSLSLVEDSLSEESNVTSESDADNSTISGNGSDANSLAKNNSKPEKAPNNSSSTPKPSVSNNVSSNIPTNTDNSVETPTQITANNQVHLYSYVSDRGWVIQTTYNYNEGDTWAKLLEKTTEISIDTTYDVNFNTIEYLKYNGKAIVLNDTPVKKSDIISNKNIYKLSTLAGPAKIRTTTMYDLINVEHAHNNKSDRYWYIRKYVINETSKTTGTITVRDIEVREYSAPDEAFNGTYIDNDKFPVTYTYTSEYGLYVGKTIELNDGSKILLGNDMYWFYLGNSNNKRILCDDYRAYKSVPNNPNDSYWSFYWSQFN